MSESLEELKVIIDNAPECSTHIEKLEKEIANYEKFIRQNESKGG